MDLAVEIEDCISSKQQEVILLEGEEPRTVLIVREGGGLVPALLRGSKLYVRPTVAAAMPLYVTVRDGEVEFQGVSTVENRPVSLLTKEGSQEDYVEFETYTDLEASFKEYT